MPKATVTKKDGTTETFEPTYIDPELKKRMVVHFDADGVLRQGLRAHELGVLVYMLSANAMNPQEVIALSAVLGYFGRDDDVDLLEAIKKIIKLGLIMPGLREGETIADIIDELNRAIFNLVLEKRQLEEQRQKDVALYAQPSNKLH